MDVLFKRKDVSGYPWFGSRDVQGSEREDIPVNSKYPLPSKALFASIDVLFTRKEVRGYHWFGSKVLQGRGGEDIPVNSSKYPLPSK